jgi:hypothetical protein
LALCTRHRVFDVGEHDGDRTAARRCEYDNESLLYFIRGEGGGLYFLAPPELTDKMLRRMDRIFPYPVIVTTIVVAAAIFILHKTRFGRHTYAIGGEAALRTGMPQESTPYPSIVRGRELSFYWSWGLTSTIRSFHRLLIRLRKCIEALVVIGVSANEIKQDTP